jgi:lambda family phage portal protein
VNGLDRLIGWLSPERGLMRARARAALSVVGAVRGYEGAKNSRRTSGWTANGTAANAEISPALSALRNRSRDQVRNNPYARSAIAKLVSRAVGTGIMARVPDSVKKPWAEFVDGADFEGQLDFYGLQALIGRTVFESGECLVRRIRLSAKGNRVPLQIQVLEPDYLDTNKFGRTSDGEYTIAGIQIDSVGRRTGYWLYKQHPGENAFLPKSLQSDFVPASEVLHVYEKERPGQLRGVPRLAVALMKLRDLDDYEDAELVRKKIEACFAAFVSGGEGTVPLANSSTSTVTNPNSGESETVRTETLSPGMIEYLRSG